MGCGMGGKTMVVEEGVDAIIDVVEASVAW